MNNLFYAILANTLLTTLFFFIGKLSIDSLQLRISRHYSSWIYIFLGLCLSVLLYSIFITSGKTILITMFWVFAFLIYEIRKETKKNDDISWTDAKNGFIHFNLIQIFWLIFFHFWYYKYTFGQEGYIQMMHSDILWYSYLANIIVITGAENILGSANLIQEGLGISPYHYFELHLNNLFYIFSKNNSLYSFVVSNFSFSVTVLSSFLYLLIWDYLKEYKRYLYFLAIPLSVVLLFYSGFKFSLGYEESGAYSIKIIGGAISKYIYVAIIFLISIKLALSNAKFYYLPLLLLPIWSYATLPSIFFGLLFYCLVSIVFNNREKYNINESFRIFIYTVFILLFMIVFFSFNRIDNELNYAGFSAIEIFHEAIRTWSTSVNIILGTLILYWIDYLPYLVLVVFLMFFRKNIFVEIINRKYILFVGIFLGGLISWSIIRVVNPDAYQLFYIPGALLGWVAIVFLLIFLLRYSFKYFLPFAISMILFGCFLAIRIIDNSWIYNIERFESKNIEEINIILDNIKFDENIHIAYMGGSFDKPEIYPNVSWFNYFHRGRFVLFNISEQLLEGLSAGQKGSAFFIYSKQHSNLALSTLQNNFLNEYNINYVIIPKSYTGATMLKDELVFLCENNMYILYGRIQ